jgi:large subunit ribosomal protein L35
VDIRIINFRQLFLRFPPCGGSLSTNACGSAVGVALPQLVHPVTIPAPHGQPVKLRPVRWELFFQKAPSMAYKFKPNKSVGKRFKVTKKGKLKRGHGYTSHLMSARTSKRRRKLGRTDILADGHARNMRSMMGISKLKPAKAEHEERLAEKEKAAAAK